MHMMQIFLLDMEGGFRGHASGQKWHEDLQWAKRLDEGWNLVAVKQVSCQSVAAHNSPVSVVSIYTSAEHAVHSVQ